MLAVDEGHVGQVGFVSGGHVFCWNVDLTNQEHLDYMFEELKEYRLQGLVSPIDFLMFCSYMVDLIHAHNPTH